MRWLRPLVRRTMGASCLGFFALLVSTTPAIVSGADEVFQSLSLEGCTASLVYRPALLMYDDVAVEIRSTGAADLLLRQLVTTVDLRDDANDLLLQPVAPGAVAAYRRAANEPVANPVVLPTNCLSQ